MGQKLLIGPVNKGLVNNRTAFVIDNDSFPTLINAYQWRGRVKRKRGTSPLGRLNRSFTSQLIIASLDGSGNGSVNLITTFVPSGQQSTSSIVPGSINVSDGTNTFTDPMSNSVLTGSPGGSGSINYATGLLTITGGAAGQPVNGTFSYYPGLPVMGLEDFANIKNDFPGTVAFDTTYAYNISTSTPFIINNTSYYDNPSTGSYAGYTQKSSWTALNWNGANYQQFWTTNYQGALWATNGINTPYTGATIGMQFKTIQNVTITSAGPPATASIQINGHGLVTGDFIFINEVNGITGINFQTGYVINPPIDANNVNVEFPNAVLAGAYSSGGIAQYLTSNSDSTKDCLRWYNGDPTGGTNPPTFTTNVGWVNFMPPLSQLGYSIADEPSAVYYLVGARMIVPFKDRLLFVGPVIQSSTSTPLYLQDTVIYSQNGTPYYTASFYGAGTSSSAVASPTNPFNIIPILVPTNQVASPAAYFEDTTGFGGFVSAGLDQPIITVSPNEDVLIMGLNPNYQTRFVYTGNDILPFNFFIINSELGSASTFSAITMDKAVISRGPRGFIMSSQVDVQRFDLEIPDAVFEIALDDNGNERFCAQRDFINEWIYFTYTSDSNSTTTDVFPNQTLQYNYRDNSWAIFNECYTTYGQFREASGDTWANLPYPTWNDWNAPWDSGSTNLFQPLVIAGNQEGFVIFRQTDITGEAPSLAIKTIAGNVLTVPNHCLNQGDYIAISGCLGTVTSTINGNVYSVGVTDVNTITINASFAPPSGTYLGAGVITRMYVPMIQTKQFPTAWELGRKTRIGVQQYLFSTTANSQITLLIFLSQDAANPYNVPNNSAVVYSSLLYTCPESTNLGLTPFNTNLQMPTAISQAQIWHRMNTSLIGDTVQIGFTLNDAQMRDTTQTYQFAEIELHSIILDINPSQMLV